MATCTLGSTFTTTPARFCTSQAPNGSSMEGSTILGEPGQRPKKKLLTNSPRQKCSRTKGVPNQSRLVPSTEATMTAAECNGFASWAQPTQLRFVSGAYLRCPNCNSTNLKK